MVNLDDNTLTFLFIYTFFFPLSKSEKLAFEVLGLCAGNYCICNSHALPFLQILDFFFFLFRRALADF